eukprot:1901099-Amphidinium_carterae.1
MGFPLQMQPLGSHHCSSTLHRQLKVSEKSPDELDMRRRLHSCARVHQRHDTTLDRVDPAIAVS